MTNYVTDALPGWAKDSWVVWPVFGVLVAASFMLAVVSHRLDGAGGSDGGPVRLLPLGRVLGSGMESLAAPYGAGPIRGRAQDLDVLRRLVKRPDGRFAVLCGTGGVGKTTIASALAQVAEAEGVRGFWVRWRGEADLAEQMIRVAVACGLPEERLESARAGRIGLPDVVWEQLGRSVRWVVVLDNVDEPASVGPGGEPVSCYRGWIRPSGKGLLLVTSRDTDSNTWGRRAVVHRVMPLEASAGAQVLLDSAPGAGTAQEAQLLSERLGGLPLALHAAGRYLAAPGSRYRTLRAYTQALDHDLAALLGAGHPGAGDPVTARTLVRYTWELSLDQLTADGITLARPVLRLLSLLGAAPVPVSLLTCGLVTAATGLPASAVTVEAAVNGLHAYGLLDTPATLNGGMAIGQVVLHPLVRDVSAIALADESTNTQEWHQALAERIREAARSAVNAGSAGWGAACLLAPHVLAVAAFRGYHDTTDMAGVLRDLAGHLTDGGHFGQAHALQHQAYLSLRETLGAEHPDTLDSLNNCANALDEIGRHQEARDLHQHVLADRERVLGPDHPNTLHSRNNLASALAHLGRHQQAVDLDQRTLADRERILGPDHPNTFISRNNLAVALSNLGRHQEAANLHQRSLADQERILGLEHPHTLISRNNLAVTVGRLGQHVEACDLHRRILADRERVLGPDHPNTLDSRNNLASDLADLGRYREAADLYHQTLTDRERVLGPDHPNTLQSRSNLAGALANLGRYREAADLYHRTLTDLERVLGPDHPHTLESRNNLARLTKAQIPLRILGWFRSLAGAVRSTVDLRAGSDT
ncbi:tetratricopeptide repeat protein [Streptomyces sp. NBC_01443]|uniref:tetratricopeptide repeat protein n=1 Tax=Streptomyces sp. NBC_01443 TaxID=2903868 RepID=UPI002259A00E|nr:tetratricopeptide repeat protein [Streptomyces sp. NBC_01443]